MTDELRDELQRLAAMDGRELSSYIRRVLEPHVAAEKEREARKGDAQTGEPEIGRVNWSAAGLRAAPPAKPKVV